MNRPIVSQGIKKLTPRGLLIAFLAVLLLIGFVVWNGGFTISKDGLTIEQEIADEKITIDHVVIGKPDPGSGVFDGESAVQPER